jgi:hypothetical protein
LVEREAGALTVSRKCRLLAVSRGSVYRRPAEISSEDCTIMALIDGSARPYRIPPVWAALPVPAGITDASMFD